MKKQITKHFMAFFLSLVMIMAMGLTAFANEEGTDSTTGSETGTQTVGATTGTSTSNTNQSEKYTLTLTETATGHTYEAYQIFTGDLSTNAEGKKVLSNVKWGAGVTYTGTESAADVAKALGNGSMTIATLEEKLKLTTPVKTVTSSKDSTVIDGLAAGYYLVKDQNGTQNEKSDAYTTFIVQVVGDTEAKIKSGVPTVEKKVKDTNDSKDETSGWQDSADADIGDDVQYQITGTMPDRIADYETYKYAFTDTMSKGLTYTASTNEKKSFNVKLYTSNDGETGTDITSHFTEEIASYVGTENEYTGGNVITWTCDNLKGISGVTLDENTKVVVTYTAQLNGSAAIGATGNPNMVYLTYSNNPNKGGEGETGKTPDDKNIVFTYKVEVNKIEKINNVNTPLKGAGFTLQKKVNGKYSDIKTIGPKNDKQEDITTFEFTGLDDGDYQLIESTTPAGYNTITPIEFTISAEHSAKADEPSLTKLSGNKKTGEVTFTPDLNKGSLTTDIENKKGSTLPSTGGRGTTMIYIIGAALVITAGVVLVMRKKMNSDK